MVNELSDIKSGESVSDEYLCDCAMKEDAYGPTSQADSDGQEASGAMVKPCICKEQKKGCHKKEPDDPFHVHEVQGLLETALQGKDAHSHRILVVSSEPKPLGKNNHFHDVIFRTDFHGGCYHEGWGTTSGAVYVGDGHVHFLEGITTTEEGHWHKYRLATSLEGSFE